jgi:hypothetical protein
LETTVLAGYTYIDPKFKEWASIDSIKNGSESFRKTDAYLNAINSSICSNGRSCENILKYRYRHTAKVDVESKVGKFSIGLSAIYNSFMENIDEVFEAIIVPGLREFRTKNDHGDLILGARAAYFPNDNLKIALIGGNLANREFTARPGKIEATRNIALRVDYKF